MRPPSGDGETALGVRLQWTPEQPVGAHDEHAHHCNPDDGLAGVSHRGRIGDICSQSICRKRGVPVGHDLGDDGGVPRAARRGDAASAPRAEHRRQDQLGPPLPRVQMERPRGLAQVIGNGRSARNHVEQDVPLRSQRHEQNAAPADVDMPGDEPQCDEREREVRGEARQHLHQRLHEPGNPRIHADPHADRYPDDGAHHGQQRHAHERDQSQDHRVADLGEPLAVRDETPQHPQTGQAGHSHERHKCDVECAAPGAGGRPACAGTAQRAGQPEHQIGDGPAHESQRIRNAGTPQNRQHQTRLVLHGLVLRDAELLGPRRQRLPQQHVDEQHHDDHGHDGPQHLAQLFVLGRHRHEAAEAGQCVRPVVHGDHLRGRQEEPAAADAHHAVP